MGCICIRGGVGEHEGNCLYKEMKESKEINEQNISQSRVALVY